MESQFSSFPNFSLIFSPNSTDPGPNFRKVGKFLWHHVLESVYAQCIFAEFFLHVTAEYYITN